MKVFFLNGVGGCGKDTFVEFVNKFAKAETISTVDEVKRIAAAEFGWGGEKNPADRKFLAAIRYAWGEYNDGPVNSVGKLLEDMRDMEQPDVVFIMVREWKEMMKMQQRFGGETIVMLNSRVSLCETEQEFLNQVPEWYEYGITIGNEDGLEELEQTALAFVQAELAL